MDLQSSDKHTNAVAENSNLGKETDYNFNYDSSKLFAIARKHKRDEIGIDNNMLPFKGYDCWNHYEVSWLNQKGKPVVATAEIIYDCSSECIVESKSLKLYFNSLNNTKFSNADELEQIIKKDISNCIGADVVVNLQDLNTSNLRMIQNNFDGICIDERDIECTKYTVEPRYLSIEYKTVKDEVLYSNLLKSNCLVTGQPDWGSVQIIYSGNKIDQEGLLKYLVSFRNHNEFHEQCIERIFVDIIKYCQPEELTVYGRYTRRGGLDINPYRTNKKDYKTTNNRLIRQ